MAFGALLLVALGLSADAFAVALARGASGRFLNPVMALRTGAMFGMAEMAMAALGIILASTFQKLVEDVDHWIALVLLAGIGGRMLIAGLCPQSEEHGDPDTGQRGGLVGNALTVLGTSIDACAVGMALAFSDVSLVMAAIVIGAVSFTASTAGLMIAPRMGRFLGAHAETAGGAVLVCIGIYIFISHIMSGQALVP